MYEFVRSIIRYNQGPSGLQPFDVSKIPLNAFYKYFKEVIIVIKDSLYNETVSIKYTDYQSEFGAFTGTINDWLLSKKDVPLTTYEEYPKDIYRTVTIHDIQYEWFTLLPGNANRSSKDQDLIQLADAPDIRVHKTNNSYVDYIDLNKKTMWLMNNHFVRGLADEKDIYLVNAGKHFQVNNNTHVCALNFNGIGEVETHGIGLDDIHYTREGNSQYLKVKCKGDLKNKTVWMVIGGRLYMNDIINVSDDNAVWVNINKVDWFDKIFTSRAFIDLTSVIDQEVAMVSKDFFQTESFFTKLLTDLSSFFVLIDNPNLVVKHIPVGNYNFPFTYHTERKEKLPLLLSNGLMPKYFYRKHVDRRLLDIDAGLHKRYLFHTTGINNGEVYHEAVNLGYPARYNRGYFLEIKALLQ